jgi:phenylacetate-coenzyme A ligase PaaK-like adenylate-forming protein
MNNKLKKSIKYIKKSGVYGNLYKNFNFNDNFDNLPFLESRHIKNIKFNKIKKDYTTYFTSGTTSKPKAMVYTKKDFKLINKYLKWFNFVEGIRKKERVLVFMDQFFWGIGNLTNKGHVNSGDCIIPVDTDLPKSAIRLIVNSSYPSIISSLPSILIENKKFLNCKSVKKIETTGEMLSIKDRKKIEKYYKAEIYDSYGLTESLIGVECCEHDGYHYLEKFVKLDIVDKNNNILKKGSVGELIVTSFFHELMPIIKYKTGDKCCLIENVCKCGINSPRVKIIGRINKEYELDEGYTLKHKEIEEIIKKIDKKIKIINVLVNKNNNLYMLNIYTSKINEITKQKIIKKISFLNQEMSFMIKRKKVKININCYEKN